jgi:hypothetical protein
MMNDLPELASPSDLNGSLISVLLPLRMTSNRALGALPEWSSNFPGYAENPFLGARATRLAPRSARTWMPAQEPPQYHTWSQPVLLAHTSSSLGDSPTIVFGCSASTVAEQHRTDQPLRMPPSVAASLWLVPGMGIVLGWEKLVPGVAIAELTDEVGSMLCRTVDPIAEPAPGGPPPSVVDLPRLFGERPDVSLVGLFGSEAVEDLAAVDGLAKMLDVTAPVRDLLVPRRSVIAGRQLIEGIVVGLSASAESRHLGVDQLLMRSISGSDVGFDEADEWQSRGFRWTYESFGAEERFVKEPARPAALCALRSDARVAVVDIDALSIRHDYLGPGGSEIVRELIQLVAVLGQIARDNDDVTKALGDLALLEGDEARESEALEGALDLARRVRVRLELRRLHQAQLLNEPNFQAWTTGAALRRVMAELSLVDEVDVRKSTGDTMAALEKTVESLEAALARREAEKQALRDRAIDEARREAAQRQSARDRADEKARLDAAKAQAEKDREAADARRKAAKDQADKDRKAADARLRDEARTKRTTIVVEIALGVVSAAGVIGVFAALASMPDKDRAVPSLASAGLWTILSLTVLGGLAGICVWVSRLDVERGRFLRVAMALIGVAGVASAVGLRTESAQVAGLVVSIVALAAGGVLALLGFNAPERVPDRGDPGSPSGLVADPAEAHHEETRRERRPDPV